MKKIIYSLFLLTVLLIGAPGVKALDETLTCVYEYTDNSAYKGVHTITVTLANNNLTLNYQAPNYIKYIEPEYLPELYRILEPCIDSSTGNLASNRQMCKTTIQSKQFLNNGKFECLPNFYYYGYTMDISNFYYYGFSEEQVKGLDGFYSSGKYIFNKNEEKSSAPIKIEDGNVAACNFSLDQYSVGSGREFTLFYYSSGKYDIALTKTGSQWKDYGDLNFTFDIPKGMYKSNCKDYGTLYTNCTSVKEGTCELSTTKKEGYTEVYLYKDQSNYGGTESGNEASGYMYENYLQQLKLPLRLSPNFSFIANYSMNVNNKTLTLREIEEVYGMCNDQACLCETEDCGGTDNIEYAINQGVTNIVKYCNTVYTNYAKDKTKYANRMKECIGFNELYDKLVEYHLVDDMSKDCPLLSNDMIQKLKWVLNLFRIIAPIGALGLGTVDFIKVIAAGDADKEMKNASKRLLTRIIAAILLLIIPTILAFLMDVFLGDKDGYNSDNPFCDLIDWKE